MARAANSLLNEFLEKRTFVHFDIDEDFKFQKIQKNSNFQIFYNQQNSIPDVFWEEQYYGNHISTYSKGANDHLHTPF